jgi:hypothetical protein
MKYVHIHVYHEKGYYDKDYYKHFNSNQTDHDIDTYVNDLAFDVADDHSDIFEETLDRSIDDFFLESFADWEYITREEYRKHIGGVK